jgi:hypothetical protein
VTVAPEIEAIVARACKPIAADRFGTARQMIDALEEYGRQRGHLASQTEVAEYVETIAGAFLDERRKMIAQRLLTRGEMLLSTLPPPPNPVPAKGGVTVGWPEDPPRHKLAPRSRYLLVIAAMVVLGGALAIVSGRSDSANTPVLASSTVLAPPALVPAPVAPADTEPAPILAPSDTATSITTPPSSPLSKNPGERARPQAGVPTRSKRAPGDPMAPAIPTQISTANPYR